MEKLWFKAKRYGWGWTPATKEGWALTVIYILLLVDIFADTEQYRDSVSDTISTFGYRFILVTILFITICYVKGEKPRWSWGNKATTDKKDNSIENSGR